MATPNFYPDRDINNQICYPIAISFPIGKYRTKIEREQTKSIPIGTKRSFSASTQRTLPPPAFRCSPSGLEERYCDPCFQAKSRAILAPHGRDARATMWVS